MSGDETSRRAVTLADIAVRGRVAVEAGDIHDHDSVVAEFAVKRRAWRVQAPIDPAD